MSISLSLELGVGGGELMVQLPALLSTLVPLPLGSQGLLGPGITEALHRQEYEMAWNLA